MRIYPRLLKISILTLVVLFISNAVVGTAPKIDLSSPSATINTYCQAVKLADISIVRECFFPDGRLEEESFKKPIWSECKIVKVERTKRIGMELGGGLFSRSGDVEVVKEVKMIHPKKGNPKTKFWYLLRNFDGKWKIISHSHIPDKNYPPDP